MYKYVYVKINLNYIYNMYEKANINVRISCLDQQAKCNGFEQLCYNYQRDLSRPEKSV